MTLVLGIETSCDETAVALYEAGAGLLAHEIHTQAATHAAYGGVVPELASRDHVRKLLPLLRRALTRAEREPGDIDAVAYTAGPGLAGALLVGAAVGRALAWTLDVAAIPVHHMEGHLLAAQLEHPELAPPFVCLLVSGGHTLLVEVTAPGAYTLLGESLDDAAGEAFDKTAKLLGLGYPGGPALARLAAGGRPDRYVFPRPMLDRPGLDMSFSGLKTHAMTVYAASEGSAQDRADIALAFECAVVDTLLAKSRRALEQTGARQLVIAGGVGANARLRAAFAATLAGTGVRVLHPPASLCTDNGAMIAYAGWLRLRGVEASPPTIEVRPRWPLTELPPMAA